MTRKQTATLLLAAGAALVVGGAAAFFFFAMPAELLEQLVTAIRLPALLPAAAPPLGDRAHAIVTMAAGLGAALATFVGFLLIGRAPRARAVRVADMPDVPELRRADSHPDAPPRRPLFAARDIGDPVEPAPVIARPAPLDLTEHLPEPPAAPVPAQADEPMIRAGHDAGDEAEWTPVPSDERDAPEFTAAAPARADAPPIAALMARLEAGLTRRRLAAEAGTGSPMSPPPLNETLRQALEELQDMAARR